MDKARCEGFGLVDAEDVVGRKFMIMNDWTARRRITGYQPY